MNFLFARTSTLALAEFEPADRTPMAAGCAGRHALVCDQSCSAWGSTLTATSNTLNRGRGLARAPATLLAGRDKGHGRQETLVSAAVEDGDGVTKWRYRCDSINARTLNHYLRTLITETTIMIVAQLAGQHFQCVRRVVVGQPHRRNKKCLFCAW
jgi:hypothetical protein